MHGTFEGSREEPPDNPDPRKPISNKVRVARAVVLPPLSEEDVSIQIAVTGMTLLQPIEKTHAARLVSLASGVADVRPLTPFMAKVINLCHKEQRLPKRMIIGYAIPHPTLLITLRDESHVQPPVQAGGARIDTRIDTFPIVITPSQ